MLALQMGLDGSMAVLFRGSKLCRWLLSYDCFFKVSGPLTKSFHREILFLCQGLREAGVKFDRTGDEVLVHMHKGSDSEKLLQSGGTFTATWVSCKKAYIVKLSTAYVRGVVCANGGAE